MGDQSEREKTEVPADEPKAAGAADAQALSTPELSAPMLDVAHASLIFRAALDVRQL
jgi:hypothetical protein